MERYTIEQRVKANQAYYENGRSNQNAYRSNETMALLRDKFNGRVISRGGDVNWPTRSCDLTPLDFFYLGLFERKGVRR